MQVVLKWALHRGCGVITKSAKMERLAENFDLFSFQLSEEQIEYDYINNSNLNSFASNYWNDDCLCAYFALV